MRYPAMGSPRGPYYGTAQICRNGHVINSDVEQSPVFNRKFCKDCGEPAITTCENCQARILGRYHAPNTFVIAGKIPTPQFCPECGKPYPWTATRLEAARGLSYELDLDPADAQKLRDTVDDLVGEGPKTELAIQRAKRILAKAGKGAGETFLKILTDVLSEATKKALVGP